MPPSDEMIRINETEFISKWPQYVSAFGWMVYIESNGYKSHQWFMSRQECVNYIQKCKAKKKVYFSVYNF